MLFLLLFENNIVLTPSTEMNLHVQDYTYLNINNPIVSIFIVSQGGGGLNVKHRPLL